MTLIDMLRPEQRQQLRQMRYRIYNREYMRRIREQRKLLCVGVDLPIEAGTCGRLVHAGYQRCIHCTRRRWWLLKHAFNDAEVSIAAMLEEHASDNDTHDDAPAPSRSSTTCPTSAIPACAGEPRWARGFPGGARGLRQQVLPETRELRDRTFCRLVAFTVTAGKRGSEIGLSAA